MNQSILGFGLVAGFVLMAGCASTTERKPTHRWEAAAKSERTYEADNASCESANGTHASNPMLADSDSFQAYKDCMLSRGYVLRTY